MMTRFLYISDTHLGAGPVGFRQQERYPERLPDILAALCDGVLARGDIDFILHGGDMIDVTTETHIRSAARAFDLPVPVYLCLGNHDLTTPDALEMWLALAPQFFVDGSPDYTITTAHCAIHVAPNQWCEHPFCWRDKQDAHLSGDQMTRLERALEGQPDRAHILLTHSPVHGIPADQTGFTRSIHDPVPAFTRQITNLAQAHRTLACVLGGHSHVNTRMSRDGVEYVTASSLIEPTFDVKLFEITSDRIEMSTIPLGSSLDFEAVYDAGKAFVQGRPVDRSFLS